jgi:hypothetical protein
MTETHRGSLLAVPVLPELLPLAVPAADGAFEPQSGPIRLIRATMATAASGRTSLIMCYLSAGCFALALVRCRAVLVNGASSGPG